MKFPTELPDHRTAAEKADKPRMIPAEDIPTSTKVINKAVFVSLGLVLAFLLVIGYWAFGPSDVLTVNNTPVPAKFTRGPEGTKGIVFLVIDYCKNIKATGKVETSFVGTAKVAFLPVGNDVQDPVCNPKAEIPILIPPDLPPGTYHVHFRVEYRINPIKNTVEEFDSTPFEVE